MRVFECLLVHFDVCWCASSERTMIECNKKQSVKGLAIIKNKIEQDIETKTLFRVYQSTNQPTNQLKPQGHLIYQFSLVQYLLFNYGINL